MSKITKPFKQHFKKEKDSDSGKPLTNKNPNRRFKYIVTCATLTFVTTIFMFIVSWVTLNGISNAQITSQRELNAINNERFNTIWELMVEANLAANIQSDTMRDRLLEDIHGEYSTKDRLASLKHELENPSDSTLISKLFSNTIDDKYMYYDTNYNNAFISVTYSLDDEATLPYGYIAATHNTVYEYIERNDYSAFMFSALIKNMYNPNLVQEYLTHMTSGSNDDIIQFIQIETGGVTSIVKGMTKNDLYEAYLIDGVAVFDSIIVSASEYINDSEDIFGTPHTTIMGALNSNYKIIVSQWFKVGDMLRLNHSAHIHEYDTRIKHTIDKATDIIKYNQAVLIIFILIWIMFVFIVVAIQNNLAQKLELELFRSLPCVAQDSCNTDKSAENHNNNP